MSHYANFTDGVPVKVSDRYKRPPSVELPHGAATAAARAQALVDSLPLSGGPETLALARVAALRAGRDTRHRERAHRLRLRDEARQQRLDWLAATEAKERLRQLCVSDVTYPSAEEPDSSAEAPDSAELRPGPGPELLRPVRAPAGPPAGLLDDPDPLEELKSQVRSYGWPRVRSVEGLTLSDFEGDTSSPFDLEELRSLDQMEVLAQVLDPAAVLPAAARTTCRAVTALGFPLRRVVRVCAALGHQRDLVVQGLLVMGELLALGYPEERVCAALARHRYCRDLALRDLAA